MGNMTIDAYQVPRDYNRKKSGSKFYPSKADMNSMRVDEHMWCLAFRDTKGLVPTGSHTDVYPGHAGTAIFTNLAGLNSKFWIMNNVYSVGVAKGHTTLDDRGTKEFSQVAIYIGGTTSVVLNGLLSVPSGTEIRLNFYDAVNDPDMYEKLFMNRNYMDGEDPRPLPVVEPHYGEDNIVDTLVKHLPLITEKQSEERLKKTSGLDDDEWANRETFLGILENLHGSVADLMAFGAIAYKMYEQRIQAGDAGTRNGYSAAAFRDDLANVTDEFIETVNEFRDSLDKNAKNDEFSEQFGRSLGNMMYNRAPGNSVRGTKDFRTTLTPKQKNIVDIVSIYQRGVRNSLHYQSDMIKWDRRWVVGKAISTANPGERLDIKLY
jgi:hypothetical protein